MGFKPTSKMQIVAIICVVLLIIGGAFLVLKKVGFFSSSEDKTTESYSSYADFRKDVNNSTFIDPIPEGTSDFKYYNHQFEDGYEEAVAFTADEKAWFTIHGYYMDFFKDYNSAEKYIEEEKIQIGFMDSEGLTYVNQLMGSGEGSYRIVRFARKDYSNSKYALGVFYNKETGRVVVFESYLMTDN